MTYKSEILDKAAIDRAIARIAHEVVERNEGCDNLVFIGIRTRGVPMAQLINANINKFEEVRCPVGVLDITLYRDDLSFISDLPIINSTEIPFSITGRDVVLCDDVLFTGRTVRAAIEALFEVGRPKSIQLAVLVDRGHRELPIRADYVGKNVPTSKNEIIKVCFTETDGKQVVQLFDKEDEKTI